MSKEEKLKSFQFCVKKIATVSGISGVLTVVAVFCWALFVIQSIPIEKIEQLSAQSSRAPSEKSLLERDSKVSMSDLKAYHGFSRDSNLISFDRWLDEKIKSGKIRVNRRELGDFAIIKSDIFLEPILQNDCDYLYCLQHRIQFDEIPSIFWQGLIGIEDYRFLDHFGVDWKSIIRAMWVDLVHMSFVQGGSTLTQQLAKNLFFSNEKTIRRKFREMVTAIYLEMHYPKEAILEAYFNEVFWGTFQGIQIKGVFSASYIYFNKSPDNISPFEAAILIAMLRGPNFYHPLRHSERLIRRTHVVYQRLIDIGILTEQSDTWSDSQWQEWLAELEVRSRRRDVFGLWHMIDGNKNEKSLTLLDPFEHFVFYRVAHEKLRELRSEFVKLENLDLAVKAKMITIDDDRKVFQFYSQPEKSTWDAVESGKRQIGSILKPIVYQILNKNGIDLKQRIKLSEIELNLLSGDWSPRELSAFEDIEEVSVGEALLNSLNRPVIQLANEFGFDLIEEELVNNYQLNSLKSPLSEYPSQLLGAVELSPAEVVELIRVFIEIDCYDNQGKILDVLSNPFTGTTRRAVTEEMRGFRFFGKTGTSNGGHDTWYIFFDGRVLGAIWLGHEGSRRDESIPIYGSSGAFPVYREFLLNRGKRIEEFSCNNLHGLKGET